MTEALESIERLRHTNAKQDVLSTLWDLRDLASVYSPKDLPGAPTRGVDMGNTPSEEQPGVQDFRTLPEPVRLEDTVATQDTREAPDPTMGRDADTEWLLKYGAG